MRVIHWFKATKEERAIARLWIALRLPVQWKADGNGWRKWEDYNNNVDVNDEDFIPGFKLRLKPDGN